MNKVILFLWFGDEKPPYIQWTLENFRKMNPGWEIRYIEYSNEQLLNYKDQDDPILVRSVEKNIRPHANYIADEYRKIYLDEHKDELIMYCDLDCFPIAPLDNFILYEDAKLKPNNEWVKNNHPNKHVYPKLMGCNGFLDEKYQEFIPDIWCLVNNKMFLNWHFLQFHKGSIMDDTLVSKGGMFMNESIIPEYYQRSRDFHNMNIKLGDNFCLPQFTPIEHYYSMERNKLNKGVIE